MRPRFEIGANGFYQYFFSDPRIKAYTSTRQFDASFEPVEKKGRPELLKTAGLDPSNLIGALQVHGKRIRIVELKDGGRGALEAADAVPDTDGFITHHSKIALSVRTADCLPLFIFDPVNSVLCLLHCGWKSLKEGIVDEALDLLIQQFSADASRLEVVLGPCLRDEDFEVGEEFNGYFPGYVSHGNCPRKGTVPKLLFNVSQFVIDCLTRHGLKADNILDTKLSTYKNKEDFFSYRREGRDSGRMLSLIWRE